MWAIRKTTDYVEDVVEETESSSRLSQRTPDLASVPHSRCVI